MKKENQEPHVEPQECPDLKATDLIMINLKAIDLREQEDQDLKVTDLMVTDLKAIDPREQEELDLKVTDPPDKTAKSQGMSRRSTNPDIMMITPFMWEILASKLPK